MSAQAVAYEYPARPPQEVLGPWAGRPERVTYPLRLHIKDAQGIWRAPVIRTATFLGRRVDGAEPVQEIVERLLERVGRGDFMLANPIAAWDDRSARTITVHAAIGSMYGSDRGLETSAGFYSGGYRSTGVRNGTVWSVSRRRMTPLEVRPPQFEAFIHTPWGYCLPDKDYRIARDYLLSGDMPGAWRRGHPSRFRLGERRVREGVGRFFVLPHIRRYVMDELSAAAKAVGMTAEHLMGALKQEIDQPAGSRNRLAAIKLGAELIERRKAGMIAFDATGTDGAPIDSGLLPAAMGGPTSRPFRVFTNEELAERRSRVVGATDPTQAGIPVLGPEDS